MASTGKPLVVVYIQGRTMNMNLAAEKAQALLTAWYPGEQGGMGIADILFGDYSPAGRLFRAVKDNCLFSIHKVRSAIMWKARVHRFMLLGMV